MKIQGPNPIINAYKNNQSKVVKTNKNIAQKDKLNISFEAKNLQRNGMSSADRTQKVSDIKASVQSGDYKINYNQTANDMINFFRK